MNAPKPSRILVVDIGGSHVKLALGARARFKFESGPRMRPAEMMRKIHQHTADWDFAVVSIGYPGVVQRGRIAREPRNLGKGWMRFDFREAFGRPVRLINDAAMQALGAYRGGVLLFLGLGTGLGTALIVDGTVVPLEIAHLHLPGEKATFEKMVGDAARKRRGHAKWRRHVAEVVHAFREVLLPEDIVLGGGNVRKLERLPPHTRRGGNKDAITGGLRLWKEKP